MTDEEVMQRRCAPVAVRHYSPEEDDTETVALSSRVLALLQVSRILSAVL